MTTGQETVPPSATEANQAIDPNPAAIATEGGGAPFVDFDDAELQAALAEAKAEETAAAAPAAGTEAPPPPAPQQAAPQGQQQDQQQPIPSIPKPRFDEALSRASKAEQDAAYWRGVAEARAQGTAQAAPGAAQAAPQITPQQQLAQIATATDGLAKRFDDGEITMAEFKREERALQSQEHAIRESLRPVAQPQAPANDGNELYLETLTSKLEDEHPWVRVFDDLANKTKSNADWDYLKVKAGENLAARGINVANKTALTTFELRKEIAVLADQLGPALVGARAQAAGIQIPGSQPPQGQQQQQQRQAPALSPAAQARQAALNKGATAPPDITALNGYTGNEGGVPTEAAIEAMSEDDIMKLPAGVRQKLRGISP